MYYIYNRKNGRFIMKTHLEWMLKFYPADQYEVVIY